MNGEERKLYELPDRTLEAVGRELDRDPKGNYGWRNVMTRGFSDLYPPDSYVYGDKQLEFASFLSKKDGHGAGLAFLKDLRSNGVAVSQLVKALEIVGHERALLMLNPKEKVIITEQPETKPVYLGKPFQLVCRGTGYPPPKYQWLQRNGHTARYQKIPRATEPELHFERATADLGEQTFCCRLKNATGMAFSKAVTPGVVNLLPLSSPGQELESSYLTVFPVQPSELVCCHGNKAMFECRAEGPGTIFYQWFRDKIELIGKNKAVLCIPNVGEGDVGSYSCRVTCGRTKGWSRPGKLLLPVHPKITFKPPCTNMELFRGQRLELEVCSSDPGDIYTWYHNDVPNAVASAGGGRYVVQSVSAVDSGMYYCVVENDSGLTTRSNAVTLRVITPPYTRHISTDVASSADRERSPLRDQEDPINGEQLYRPGGLFSRDHSLTPVESLVSLPQEETANEAPVITFHPQSKDVRAGSCLRLECHASGCPPPHYFWRHNGHEVVDGEDGGDGAVLFIRCVERRHEGKYECVVYNNISSPVKSNSATVRVTVVRELPTIIKQPPPVAPVVRGRNVTLECVAASGSLEFSYEWKRGSKTVEADSARCPCLHLQNVCENGYYHCLVRNSLDYSIASNITSVEIISASALDGVEPMDTDDAPAVTLRGGSPGTKSNPCGSKSVPSQETSGTEDTSTKKYLYIRDGGKKLYFANGKIAVLIANANYKEKPLAVPEHDVTLIADLLRRLNYQVFTFIDLSASAMKDVVQMFLALVSRVPGAYTLFYFAGHGFEVCSEQLLLGIDGCPGEVEKAIRLLEIQQQLAPSKEGMHTFILDCCRNPSKREIPLEPECQPPQTNMITQYSCCPSSSAFEVPGSEYSLYTEHFSKCLQEKGDESVFELLDLVQDALGESMRKSYSTLRVNQNPELSNNLCEERSLNDPILQTEENFSAVFIKWERQLNATPADHEAVLRSSSIEVKVKLCFVSYMTNCYLIYLVNSRSYPHLTVSFNRDKCEVGGGLLVDASQQPSVVSWLLSKIATSSNVVHNQSGAAAVAKLCTLNTSDKSRQSVEPMDVDMKSAVPNKVFSFVVEFSCTNSNGANVSGEHTFSVEMPQQTLFATDGDFVPICTSILSNCDR